MTETVQWLSAIPGVAALLGAAVGIGSMHNRLKVVEQEVKPVAELRNTVSQIDERTKTTNERVKDFDSKLDRILEAFAFRERARDRDRDRAYDRDT